MNEPAEAESQGAPGCGLGLYAGLLLLLGAAGAVGLVVATMALFQNSDTTPTELLAGSAVPTWRLAPMIEAGVLPPGQVPLAWHDESAIADGTRACALLADAVVRVQDGQGSRVPFAEIVEATGEELPDGGQAVLVDGRSGDVTCLFRAGEGGLRFLRQVQTEVLRIQRAP